MRTLFKTVVLGIQYGLGLRSFAARAGLSSCEAGEILARLRARFHRFEDYTQQRPAIMPACIWRSVHHWGGGCRCQPASTRARSVTFPIQSTGARFCTLRACWPSAAEIELVAPVHDALMAEGPVDQAEELSTALIG